MCVIANFTLANCQSSAAAAGAHYDVTASGISSSNVKTSS